MKRMRIPSDNLPRCGQQIIKRLLAIGKNQKWLAAQCKVSCTAITYIILKQPLFFSGYQNLPCLSL